VSMSKSSFDENKLLFAPFIAASGMFTGNTSGISLFRNLTSPSINSSTTPVASIYNPMPPEVRHSIREVVPVTQQESFIREFHESKRHKIFERSAFQDYAQTLFERLVPELLRQLHDVFLFPLRGCRQPGILVKVMAGLGEEKMVIFNYTFATQENQQSLIVSQLTEQLIEKISGRQNVSLGVVDTAKGGYGSNHLAKLLSEIHARQFAKQKWTVQFHLIHECDVNPAKSYPIPKYGNDFLDIRFPLFYPVDSLLVEDWSEGIGLSVEESGKHFELKRCVQPGRILYRDEDSIQLIESEAVCDTMTGFTVDAVNRLMLSSPEIKYVKDVWKADVLNGHCEGDR
jgi:hypothetical protein